jgi:hypothetical protein
MPVPWVLAAILCLNNRVAAGSPDAGRWAVRGLSRCSPGSAALQPGYPLPDT